MGWDNLATAPQNLRPLFATQRHVWGATNGMGCVFRKRPEAPAEVSTGAKLAGTVAILARMFRILFIIKDSCIMVQL